MNAKNCILALIILFGIICLFKSSGFKEPFIAQIPMGNYGLESAILDPLYDLGDIMDIQNNLGKKRIPAEDKPIWLCDSKWTGAPVRGVNLGIDCNDPKYNCQPKKTVADNCSYIKLPSTTNTIVDTNTTSQIEMDEQDLPTKNIYIPPTMNTCKLGCTNPVFSNINLDSYSLWKCDQDSVRKDLLTLKGYTENESNVDLCKHDTDCIWCNNVEQ